MGIWTPLLLAAFVATATAVPTGLRYNCASTCGDASKFAFQRGMSYEYDYKTMIDVASGPDTELAMTNINAKAIVSVLAPCEYSLSLENVVLEGSDSSEFSLELTKAPLRFAFDDGRISSVCSSEDEPAWVTNFKRGVLSTFQNSLDSFDESKKVQFVNEVEVVGECEARYELEATSEDTYVISRSSSDCSNIPISSTISLPLAIQRLPLVSSSFESTQTVVAGIIQKVETYYHLELKAVSGGAGGAINYGKSTLELVNVVPSEFIPEFPMVTSSLKYDDSLDEETAEGHIRSVEKTLSDLDHSSWPLVKPEMPVLFSQLVENLRNLNQRQLSIVYEANRNSRVWKYLVDAAPLVATPASMLIVKDLILSDQLTEEETQAWFTSLAFVPKPTVEMFRPLPELVASQFSKEALLGVSALVNSYCKIDRACTEKSEIKELLSLIELNLGSACRSSSFEEKEKILVVLKALGNAGHFMNTEIVEKCYTEESNPAEVRVAALEAWRRAPCNYDRSGLLRLLENTREDSEIRIAAYLSLMACPTQELIHTVKDRLISESVNQVGSFIWSHLTNLQESASHEKQWIRALIGEEMLSNKFNTTSLKLSRNFESSFYMEESGYGATFDSNLIFSSKSFLPRSAMLNFTLDLFGESINMFEIGGRIEGFEIFAEKFFGPNGYYPEETVEAILQNLRKSQSGPETTLEHMLDVVTSEPEGSYYLRILDNDVKYHHFRGIDNFFEKKPDFSLTQMLSDFAKTGKTEYTKSYKLIDTELTYPTIIGLPLILKLNGTATLGFVLSGQFAMTSFSNIDINSVIAPSAALQVDATMLVDAHVSKSGVKVTSNVFSSAFIDGKVKIEGGKVADISIQAPQEKTELLKVNVQGVFIKNDKEITPESNTLASKWCTPTSTILGMQLCSEYSSDEASADASIYVEATDSQREYTFRYLNQDNSLSLLIDTPGSKIDRKFSIVAIREDDEVKVDIYTPWKSMKASGTRIVRDRGNLYELELALDSTNKYQVSAGYSMDRAGSYMKLEPTLVIRTPSRTFIDFSGDYEINSERGTVSINLKNTGITQLLFSFSSARTPSATTFNSRLESDIASGEASGSINKEDGFLSQFDLKYSRRGLREHSFSSLVRFGNTVRSSITTTSAAISVSSSQFPWMSLHSKAKYNNAPGRIESSFSINYGVDSFALDVDKVITYTSDSDATTFETRVTVVSLTHDVDAMLSENLIIRRNYFLQDAVLRLSPGNELKSKVELGISDEEGFARSSILWGQMNIANEISYTKINDHHYTAQIFSHRGSDRWSLEASFKDASVRGQSIQYQLGAESVLNDRRMNLNLEFSADRQRAFFDARAKNANNEYFATLEATTTSLKLNSNCWKHITFEAQVVPEGETKSVTVTGVWDKEGDATEFGIDGSLTSTSVAGNFKFGTIERSFKGALGSDGASVYVKWDQDKEITGKVSYSQGETTLFSATLATPFESYENNNIIFAFRKIDAKEFGSTLKIIAGNTEIVAFEASGKVKFDNLSSEAMLDASLNCSKVLFGADQISFQLRHSKTGLNLDSSVTGTVDGREILTGKLVTSLGHKVRTVSANLVTPFTENLSFNIHHVLFESNRLELQYGERRSEIRYEKKNLPDGSGIEFDMFIKKFDCDPMKIRATMKGPVSERRFEINTSYGSVVAQAIIDYERIQVTNGVKHGANVRVIVPNRAPITGSASVIIENDGKLITEFEMTRFWSSYGNVKGHFTKTCSPGKFSLDGSVTSPRVRASIDTMLALDSNNIDSYFKFSWNGVQKEATLKGSYDPQLWRGKLRGSWIVSESEVFKFGLDHELKENEYVTTMKIKLREAVYDVHHELSLTNSLNWINNLTVNEYAFFNEMAFIEATYTHDFNWKLGRNFIRGQIALSAELNENPYVSGDLNLASSWTEDIVSKFKYESIDSRIFKPEIMVKYGEQHVLLKSVCSCTLAECSVKVVLDSSFWEFMSLEFIMTNTPAIKISFIKGTRTTTVDLTGAYEPSSMFGKVHVASDFLQFPVTVEGSIINNGDELSASLSVIARDTYKGTLTASTLTKSNGNISVELDVPCINLNRSYLQLEYNFDQDAWEAMVKGKINSEVFDANGVVTKNNFKSEVNILNQLAAELKADWKFENGRGAVHASFANRGSYAREVNFAGDYTFLPSAPKQLNVNVSGPEFAYELALSFMENEGTLKSGLTIANEKFTLTAAYGNSEFSLNCASNRGAINVRGQYRLNSENGKISAQLSSSIPRLTSGSIAVEYNLANTKDISFSTSLEEIQFSCTVTADVNDWKSPRLTISGQSYLAELRTFGAEFTYDFKNPEKELQFEINRNTEKISGYLQTKSDLSGYVDLLAKLSSPLRSFENVEIGMQFKMVNQECEATVYTLRNGDRKEYEFKAITDERHIRGHFISTSTAWRKITFNGSLDMSNARTFGTWNMSVDNNPYSFTLELNRERNGAKLEISTENPIEKFRHLKFVGEYQVLGTKKSLDVSFTTPEQTYACNAYILSQYKKAEAKAYLALPVNNFRDVAKYDLNASYDLTGNSKTAAVTAIWPNTSHPLYAVLRLNDNNIILDLRTPFRNYRQTTLAGDLVRSASRTQVVGELKTENLNYKVSGEIDIPGKFFNIRIDAPNGKFKSIELRGEPTPTGYILVCTEVSETFKFVLDYSMQASSASFKVTTPIRGYERLAFEYDYFNSPSSARGLISLVQNEKTNTVQWEANYGQVEGNVKLSADLPLVHVKSEINGYYDFAGNNKVFNLEGRYNEHVEKLSFIMNYSTTSAAIGLAVPFINEEFGIRYSFVIDENNNRLRGMLEGKIFSKTYLFEANAAMTPNLIELEVVTPIEGYRRVLGRGEIDTQQKYFNAEVIMANYEAKLELRYSLEHSTVEIKTPFKIFEHVKLSYDLTNTREMTGLTALAKYNSYSYDLGAIFTPSDAEKMIDLYLQTNEQRFGVSGGGYFDSRRVQLTVNFQLPIQEFSDIGFSTVLDWGSDDKVIRIALKSEGKDALISLHGNFLNDEVDLEIKSPFKGLEHFQTRGALNRSKRSIEFAMMNDRARGGIVASFNSLTVKIASPYPAINDATLTVEKPDAGGLSLHYKRSSDVHVDFTATPSGRSNTYDISLDAVIPSWEFQAVLGEMNKDELIPYLEGQRVQPRSTIKGGGSYSRSVSDLRFDITTPRQNLESVTVVIKKNIRRKEFKLDVTSSSDFKILINTKPKFTVDIFVPNPAEPTIIKADLELLKGSINISSRFSRWRTFNWSYEATLGQQAIKFNANLERNGVQVFNVEFERESAKAHLKIEGRSGNNHSVIHFHREGFEMISFSFMRNGKELKIEAQGTGDLPRQGSLDVVVNNSFRTEPRTITAHVEVDRTGSPKTVRIEATYPGNRLYTIDAKYNINLRRPQTGDYDIRITTPERRAYPWQHLAGSWDFRDHENAVINFESARAKYSVKGKIYLREGNVVMTREAGGQALTRNFEWRLYKTATKDQRTRDYYIKYGTDEKFILIKLKGTFSGLRQGETEYGFQFFPIMSNAVSGSVKWQRDSSGLTGDGSFTAGEYSGTYVLKRLKREASTRSLVLSFEANTNIPRFTHVTVEGEYNFDHQAFVKLDIKWDVNNISINVNIQDITSNYTEQTASFHFPSLGDVTVTFGHDFRDKKNRKFTAVSQLNGRESTLNASWSRNKDFTKLSGNVEINSIFLGHITIDGQYDVRDLNKAKAEIQYKRNDDKNVHIKWTRNVTDTRLRAEILFESHFRILPRGKILVEADFENGLRFNFLAQRRNREIKASFNIEANSITGEITTPYPGFEQITGSLIYNLEDKNHKTVTLRYLRGDRAVNLDINLDLVSQRSGTLKVALETPFTFVRTLTLDASWKDNKGEVHYKRNDIAYSFTGQAEVKTDGTSFELVFTPTSNEPVKVGFNFNPGSFVSGQGSQPEDVARVEIELLGKRVALNLRGYRNSEHLMIEVRSETNLDFIEVFEITLDSELNSQRRNGLFEIKINDFYYKMRNFFERRGTNGFYLRSQIDSSITDLPGVIIGVGKEGEERIVTVGVGEDREITVNYTPKDNFRRGVSGRISAPKRGIYDAAFDVGYSFSGPNVLNINYDFELEPGKKTQASIEYNSDGVRGRFGDYSFRVKRSITEDGFSADVGFNDYNLTLRGDVLQNGIKKGFIVSGEVFGTKVSVDAFLQKRGTDYFEGKFIVTTSLRGYENLGGFFTYANVENKINVRSEINLPSYITPKVFLDAAFDFSDKIIGRASIDLSGQVFSVDLNLNSLSLSNVEGRLELKTPFHFLSEVKINGKFKNVPGLFNAEVNFECPLTGKQFNLKLNYQENLGATKYYATATVNKREINFHFEKFNSQINGKFNLISDSLSYPVLISFSGDIPRSALLTASVSGVSNALSYSFELENKQVSGTLMVDSPYIGKRHMISLLHNMPNNYLRDDFDAEISFTTDQTRTIFFNVDRRNGFKSTITVECPSGTSMVSLLYRLSASVVEASASVKLANFGGHSINFNLRRPPTEPLAMNISLQSSLFEEDFDFSFRTENSNGIKMRYQTLRIGSVTETLNFGYSYTDDRAYMLIDVDSHMLGKAKLTADINLLDVITMLLEIQVGDDLHGFEVTYVKEKKEMIAVLNSSLIPGKYAKAEASMTGNSVQKMTTDLALHFKQAVYAAKLELDAESTQDVEANLEILTPIEGYKKLNFGLEFENDDELRAIFYASKPFGYKFILSSDKGINGYDASVDIVTPVRGFEAISASLKLPLDKTAAQVGLKLPQMEYGLGFETENEGYHKRFSGNLNVMGFEVEGGYRLRTKAPYELAVEAVATNSPKPWRYHIMADPSMASFLTSNLL